MAAGTESSRVRVSPRSNMPIDSAQRTHGAERRVRREKRGEIVRPPQRAQHDCEINGFGGRAASAANSHFAEAYQHAAARLRTSETELRPEAREEHYLIKLALHGLIVGARENLVINHFARCVQRRL